MEAMIPLPDGATLLESSEFHTSHEWHNDTLTRRVVLGYKGHQINVLWYECDPHKLSVCVDGGSTRVIPMGTLNKHLRAQV